MLSTVEYKIRKYLAIVIVVVILAAIVYGLVTLAGVIVRKSYSSVELLDADNRGNVPDIDVVTNIVYDNPDEKFSTVKVLYSDYNIEERQKEYLGSDYDVYKPVIDVAVSNYKSILDGVECVGRPENEMVMYAGDMTEESLEMAGRVELSKGLSVIGMYDGDVLVLSYERWKGGKPTIVLVDTGEMLFDTSSTALYSFGSGFSVVLEKGKYVADFNEGYTIIYIRG